MCAGPLSDALAIAGVQAVSAFDRSSGTAVAGPASKPCMVPDQDRPPSFLRRPIRCGRAGPRQSSHPLSQERRPAPGQPSRPDALLRAHAPPGRPALPLHRRASIPSRAWSLPCRWGWASSAARKCVELELDEACRPKKSSDRLAQQAPPGLDILTVRRIDRKIPPRSAASVIASPCRRNARPRYPTAHAAVLAAAECWVERLRPASRTARPSSLLRATCAVAATALEMDLWVTPTGTARPDEVLGLLGLGDLLEAGAVLERTTMELHDEMAVSEPPAAEAAWCRSEPRCENGPATGPDALLLGVRPLSAPVTARR